MPFSGQDGLRCQDIYGPDVLGEVFTELGGRVKDVQTSANQRLHARLTSLECDSISCIGVDLPTHFSAVQFGSAHATISLPFSGFTIWRNDCHQLVERGGETIVYIAPNKDIDIYNKGSFSTVVFASHADLEVTAFRLARGMFHERKIRDRLGQSSEFQLSNPADAPLIRALYNCCKTLHSLSFSAPTCLSDLAIDDSFIRILVLLLFPEIRQRRLDQRTNGGKSDCMSSLEEWIKANLNQKLTLSQLEDFCGYSARAIHDHFSIKYQLSPKQWVIQQRVMHAYQLLSGGDSRPMSMIAKDCGYLDPSRFARHFQQEYGFTPHQCRKASTVRI